MTLDRPARTEDNSRNSTRKLSSYPPVLGYLATLTRSKATNEQQKKLRSDASPRREPVARETEQQQTDRSGVRRLSGLFAKNAKIRAKPGVVKAALFRSRSKDSVLAESTTPAEGAPWQHKSSVPCYVGWRPPMPLPKGVDPEATARISRRSVIRTESRRSNLGWRKYSSESDLIEASESGYTAIDRPLGRRARRGSFADLRPFDEEAHTLPRQPAEQRVHFQLRGAPLASRVADADADAWYDLWQPDGSLRLCEIAQL